MLTQKFLDLTASFGADWVNFVLIGVSIVGLAVFIDRAVFYARTAERFPGLKAAFSAALAAGDLKGALRAVEGDSFTRNVVRAGLELAARGERQPTSLEQAMLGQVSEERGRYEARLSVLATIGNVAPLIGLLGTVIGIIGAFYVLGKVGTVQASSNSLVMASIGESLVTTGVGITVAVPAVVAYNALKAHVNGRLKQAEALSRELVANLPRLETNGGAEG
jgi:biopolymer transport protein ExbB/TolQ